MKGGAEKSPTVAKQPQFDALDMVGGKIVSATERLSNQGDITPLSLQNKKSPRTGLNNQPHQHPHL